MSKCERQRVLNEDQCFLERPRGDESIVRLALHGGRVACTGCNADVDAEKERRSGTDQMTGLANRWRLYDDFRTFHGLLKRGFIDEIGFMQTDVVRFGLANNLEGQVFGDSVAIAAAESMNGREEDTVARLGGDEMGVLVPIKFKMNEHGVIVPAEEQLQGYAARTINAFDAHPTVTGFNERHGFTSENGISMRANFAHSNDPAMDLTWFLIHSNPKPIK